MTARLIDGKALAAQIREQVAADVQAIKAAQAVPCARRGSCGQFARRPRLC